MKFVRLTHDGSPRLGALTEDGTVRLTPAGVTLGQLLADRSLRENLTATSESVIPFDPTTLLPSLEPTALMINVGANYHEHALPSQDAPVPSVTWFSKAPQTWIAAGAPIRLPVEFPDRVDYEGELCVVFGADCHRVKAADAWDYIGGYTVLNDVSARDAWPQLSAATTPAEERAAWNRMLLGKQLPTFGPVGPAVVTADEVTDPLAMTLTTTLNDEEVQRTTVAKMKVGIPDLVEQLSRYFAFRPGDVISTGTPGGVGQARGRFLRAGDRVTVSVDGVGRLTNPVVDSSFSPSP
ncbi:fumarylacetoacetate hydrolase family protein [Flexivirga meconopsidis]|uniref:fumarylacetoacetate hydrolase family protein n=1 Tax=Flexivirga meconopsidis TaxID=2977121 RepID=UPI00224085CC|nr:fumarylacetoacetate hydrolase family protein [Flexivirga meconopsidis]